MRQEGLTNEVQGLRQKLDEQEAYKKKFKACDQLNSQLKMQVSILKKELDSVTTELYITDMKLQCKK